MSGASYKYVYGLSHCNGLLDWRGLLIRLSMTKKKKCRYVEVKEHYAVCITSRTASFTLVIDVV